MAGTAERTDPALWDAVKKEVMRGDKGGQPDQWSARKAQLAVSEYKKRGGGYKGRKSPENHLVQWTQEAWGTVSGRPSGETHERYLPKKARQDLSESEYRRTTAKKRADSAKGKQFSRQPEDVAKKVADTRAGASRHDGNETNNEIEQTKGVLMEEARRRNIRGRSGMTKQQLAEALRT